ncbi:hypothetical protein GIB67_024866 [Kingdonia uniflora]|uniref:BTB domain-containing protein n=1 Tax=Kingdonia uniflora TaxID=39325 RepID=A0A7J7NZ79_9MAGN|nr:hypothetical protein GIB67_024866 [Kingdonia uniflora]
MDASSSKTSSLTLSPYSSPNVAALLKIRIMAWSKETGLPVAVRIRVGGRVFHLNKYPLISKSGYFKKALHTSTEIKLPDNFPGGPKVFEMVVLFTYGSFTLIDSFNVTLLKCATEFLEMNKDYGSGNLCDHSDLYRNQVVLQSWDDTLLPLS